MQAFVALGVRLEDGRRVKFKGVARSIHDFADELALHGVEVESIRAVASAGQGKGRRSRSGLSVLLAVPAILAGVGWWQYHLVTEAASTPTHQSSAVLAASVVGLDGGGPAAAAEAPRALTGSGTEEGQRAAARAVALSIADSVSESVAAAVAAAVPVEPSAPPPTARVWTPGERHPTDPHLTQGATEGTWVPDPGYTVEGNLLPRARWAPGREHPQRPNVRSAARRGEWEPMPGYSLVRAGSLETRWTAGLSHPEIAHIRSTDKENRWKADPGYVFQKDFAAGVVWNPGEEHEDFPHVRASAQEGRWAPDPGFDFVRAGSLEARWKPGLRHRDHAHVIAGDREGVWSVESGYAWVAPSDPHDLRAYALPTSPPTNWDGVFAAVLKLATAQVAVDLARNEDSFFGAAVLEIALTERSNAAYELMSQLLPGESRSTHGQLQRLLCWSLDNPGSLRGLLAMTTREALLDYLRREQITFQDASHAVGLLLRITGQGLKSFGF